MSNFNFLKNEKQFEAFADVAMSAEKIISIDTEASVLNCRRAMEFAIKWMYSVDSSLQMPYQDNLVSLMNSEDFREIVGLDIWRRLDLIRRIGNNAAHSAKKISYDQAELCIKNLYIFLDFVAYCYADNYIETEFDENQKEVKCPECNNVIELDWSCDDDCEDHCGDGCDSCGGCGHHHDTDQDIEDDM